MHEKFVVKIINHPDISHFQNELYLLFHSTEIPLTGIAHDTEEKAKSEIENYLAKHPTEDAVYRIEKYYLNPNYA